MSRHQHRHWPERPRYWLARIVPAFVLLLNLWAPAIAPATDVDEELDDQTEVKVSGEPLRNVLDFLSDLHNVEIALDEASLRKASIQPDIPLHASLSGIRFRSALSVVLRQVGLTWETQDGKIRVFAPDDGRPPLKPQSAVQQQANRRLREKLRDVVSYELVNRPLSESLQAFSDQAAVPILIDDWECNRLKVDPSAVSLTAAGKRIPLQIALERLLREHDFKAIVWDEVVLVRPIERSSPKQALNEKTTIGFIDSPLPSALDFLTDLHNVRFRIDDEGLKRAGVSRDTRISFEASEITLSEALTKMLKPHGLTYNAEHRMIVITDK